MPLHGTAPHVLHHVAGAAEQVLPARGVPLEQVIPVTVGLGLVSLAVLAACVAYRQGRLPALERVVTRAEEVSGLPAWAAIPSLVSMVSLLVAGFGFYWDVAQHIDNGRDASPFGTPAHYPILAGLLGLALAGVLAIALDRDTDGRAALHLPFGLHCSLGAGLVLLCGTVSLAGFPLDDLWHATFGQDVTLWGPTHIQMVGGASLTTLATWVLVEEGRRRSDGSTGTGSLLGRVLRPSTARIAGSFLVGLSTLQGEFDYGVPQFNSIYHPLLISLAAGIGLVAARVRVGRGGALQAWAMFMVLRLGFGVVIAGVFGLSFPHVPLYLVEALLVEAVAYVVPVARHARFGALAGLLVGTVGVASEWAFSQVAFVLPWKAALFPEAAVLALLAGVAGGLLGAQIGRALLPSTDTRQISPRFATGLAFAACLAVIGVALPISTHPDYRASVDTLPAARGTADLVVRLTPASAAHDAAWFNVTSWQGGRDLVPGTGQQITLLREIAPGTYRTTHPVPVSGKWKTLLRIATSTSQQAVPVYLPEDKAIPAALVPAAPHFDRPFVADQKILQREAIGGSNTLKRIAYGVLGVLALLWIATLSLGLRRLDRSAVDRVPPLALGFPRLLPRTRAGATA